MNEQGIRTHLEEIPSLLSERARYSDTPERNPVSPVRKSEVFGHAREKSRQSCPKEQGIRTRQEEIPSLLSERARYSDTPRRNPVPPVRKSK
ncbi:hypothetical protein, partial [Neobacillus cucumis]|uniref:hypothetical protein n=1 Tax=Neobacillus cucumis TaxID=1740721 RepID=UPI002E1B5FE8|nr:hypothetical protein [Neobacillus cucumis]